MLFAIFPFPAEPESTFFFLSLCFVFFVFVEFELVFCCLVFVESELVFVECQAESVFPSCLLFGFSSCF